MPRLLIPEKLEPFLFVPKRFKVAFGGRGGAKSQSFADMLLYEAQTKGHKVGCFRETQNSIEDSVHSLLSEEIDRMSLEGFGIQKNQIFHEDGGLFKFGGLSRNTEAVKSKHGFNRFWVEEAQSISAKSLKMLTPTLRTDDSEIWFSLNPSSAADPMSQRFLVPFWEKLLKNGYYEDDLHLIVWINHYDNPWFPDVLEQERLFDFENKPRNEYDHIWLGHFNDTVENAIIKPEWFDAAIDAHIKLGFKPRGIKVVSHDPSDSGPDPKALSLRHGSVVLDVRQNDKCKDVNDGCDWALDYAIENNADLFNWDCDGMGISLKRQVKDSLEGKHIDYQIFKGSDGVDDPDEEYQVTDDSFDPNKNKTNRQVFKNQRAQYYWMLAQRFYSAYRAVVKGEYIDPDELISISSEVEDIQGLKSEVCRIPRKPNGNGLIQIMTKEEMKNKYQIASPNRADCLMMSMRIESEEPVKHNNSDYSASASPGGWMRA